MNRTTGVSAPELLVMEEGETIKHMLCKMMIKFKNIKQADGASTWQEQGKDAILDRAVREGFSSKM